MLRGEVGSRVLRARSDVRGHRQVRLCKALGCGRCGCLKPIRACCVVGSAFFLVAPPRGGCAMAPRDSGMCWKQFMMCLEDFSLWRGIQHAARDPIRYLRVEDLPTLFAKNRLGLPTAQSWFRGRHLEPKKDRRLLLLADRV